MKTVLIIAAVLLAIIIMFVGFVVYLAITVTNEILKDFMD